MLRVSERLQEGIARMKKASTGIPDRVPVYAQMSHHSARLAGESTYRFFTNAYTFLNCELAADEFYGLDAPTIHYDFYNIEAEAMGAIIIYSVDDYPTIDPRRPLLPSVSDFRKLKSVRMGKDGRMPYVLEINKRLVDVGLSPKVRFCGIFTLAAKLLGYENLVMSIKSESKDVHALMRYLTDEIVAPWIQCQRAVSGISAVATGSEALASPPLVTLEILEDFSLQYGKRLENNIGGIRLAGLWGESMVKDPVKLLDMKKEYSQGMLQVCDPDVNILGPGIFKKYVEKNNIGLIMGIDANLIRNGPVSAIKARSLRYIQEAGRDGRFVLFINDIPYDTPPEHVHAVVEVAHAYRYEDKIKKSQNLSNKHGA
jgi:uroporphyrinogen-III decarboxylase